MSILTYSEARANFKAVCDRVVDDCDVATIHRRDGENVVIMGESEFNSWKETIYLLSNPNNATRLLESIAQAESGSAKPRTIEGL
ncbi:type II toxin-antitoxin system Phd/YefM family antitoxin [Shewanella submarina]|uniref:Antitoxin n=1 Tax=Shewanella submarina TaxID=2016376 RepID=A0ABV7G8I4_9GAMM|nr:type II toxin-antitoxin system Phd/YefM family antitoxin [Shewanella submarina]MCL1038349.1 type II toxin-antitoxin system Phd/YefM family antitoxin [Shewanella submarina]